MRERLLEIPYQAMFYDELEEYELAIQLLSDHLAASPVDSIALNNRGVANREIGRINEAIADFTASIENDPNNPVPYINRGKVLEKHGSPEAALEDFQSAIDRAPTDPTFFRTRGHFLARIGRWADAILDFTTAIEIDPNFKQTRIDRADAYEQLGESAAAEADREAARRL